MNEPRLNLKEIIFGKRYRYRLVLTIFMTLAFHFGASYGLNVFSYKIIREHDTEANAQLFTSLMPLSDVLAVLVTFLCIESAG